ncbi:MAG: DUF3500 domain-containing protein [Isosphaeraceae bacterium]|nr:DUF3500 domain-containing protein [Isosphaeraceae bacterium]
MAEIIKPKPIDCPACREEESLTRRDFVRTVGGAALAGGLLPLIGSAGRAVAAGPTPKSAAETAVKRLYDSLSAEQRKTFCFPFDHPLRQRINANWAITKPTIDDAFTQEQQAIIDEIFRGVTSKEGYERFQKQMDEDYGGFGQYHIALFGEPGSGKFEFEMTGRHLTIRADGDSVENAAFGGPIVYGHGTGDSQKGLPGNVFYYQTKKANEVFQALDGKQRQKALVPKAPPESQVPVQGESGTFPGISVGELSKDQKELVESVIRIILAPYREEDVQEAMEFMKAGGGLDALHMAFYESGDIGKDQEWDIWRLEGPTMVWHFRGSPHVHAYVNIAKKS